MKSKGHQTSVANPMSSILTSDAAISPDFLKEGSISQKACLPYPGLARGVSCMFSSPSVAA